MSTGTGLLHNTNSAQDPGAYIGAALQIVRVNAAGTDTEWVTVLPASSVTSATGAGLSLGSGGIPTTSLAVGSPYQTVRVNAAGTAWEVGPLNLQAGAAVTGSLSGANVNPGFGTQAIQGASLDTSNATVLAIAQSNAVAVSFGAAPVAATGLLRVPKNTSLTARNSINTGDYNLIGSNGADVVLVGDNAANNTYYQLVLGGSHFFRGGAGSNKFTVSTVSLTGSPINGDASETICYHALSGTAAITPAAGATRNETAINLAMRRLVYGPGAGQACTVTMATPPNAVNYYEKTIENNSGFGMTFTCGAGTQRSVATGFVAVLGFFSTGDVRFVSAAVAP